MTSFRIGQFWLFWLLLYAVTTVQALASRDSFSHANERWLNEINKPPELILENDNLIALYESFEKLRSEGHKLSDFDKVIVDRRANFLRVTFMHKNRSKNWDSSSGQGFSLVVYFDTIANKVVYFGLSR